MDAFRKIQVDFWQKALGYGGATFGYQVKNLNSFGINFRTLPKVQIIFQKLRQFLCNFSAKQKTVQRKIEFSQKNSRCLKKLKGLKKTSKKRPKIPDSNYPLTYTSMNCSHKYQSSAVYWTCFVRKGT